SNWAKAVTGDNLLQNGDMEAGEFNAEKPSAGRPAVWKTFTLDPATGFEYTTDSKTQDRILRVIGSGATGTTVDGGYVQRVEGLSRVETYRLEGQIRCSWPLDVDQALMVGYDPTGQTEDAEAATIEWKMLPPLYGHFLPYESEP